MSSFYLANPRNKSPERALSLQKYLLLHSQHEDLARRLSASGSSHSPPRYRAGSATSQPRRASLSSNYSDDFSLSSSPSSPSALTPELEEDEEKLCHVNNEIKSTLTTLLNCDSVKHDAGFRTWVQTRLMEAEKELKDHKRRKSSTFEDKDAIVDSIAHGLEDSGN